MLQNMKLLCLRIPDSNIVVVAIKGDHDTRMIRGHCIMTVHVDSRNGEGKLFPGALMEEAAEKFSMRFWTNNEGNWRPG